jgi:sugar phosphate permease
LLLFVMQTAIICRMSLAAQTVPDVRPTSTRLIVLIWLCLAAAISYICRLTIGVAESTIRSDLDLSKEMMGLIMSLFYLPYALGQIPGGWLAERFGSRRSIPLVAVGWSLATLSLSAAFAVPVLLAGWLANGFFQAGLFPCCARTVSKWFPANRRAFASGMLASSMFVGGALGSVAMGYLLEESGWRTAFAIFGSLGILWAVGFWFWFRDEPGEHGRVNESEVRLIQQPIGTSPTETMEVIDPWRSLLLSPATWCICSQQFCRAAGTMFFGSWFATYLQQTHGVSIKFSGFLNSLPQTALIIGSLFGGTFSDWVLSRTASRRLARQAIAASCMFTCACFVFIAYTLRQPVLAVLTISAGTLFSAIGGPTAYAITIDMGGKHLAKLFSCMNMCGNVGAAMFIFGVPWFLDATGKWDAVVLMFGALWVGAGIFWLLLNPNGDIFQQSLWKKKPHPII